MTLAQMPASISLNQYNYPDFMSSEIAAETIAEELLFNTGKAILGGDDSLFLFCVRLPLLLETATGQRLITTRKEICTILADFRQYLRDENYVDMVRTVVEANFIDADTIGSTHVTLLTQASGAEKRCPFPVYSIIRRFGNKWLLVFSLYAILDSEAHNDALLSKSPDKPPVANKEM